MSGRKRGVRLGSIAVLSVSVLVLAGCGTREPNGKFPELAGQAAVGGVSSGDSTATGQQAAGTADQSVGGAPDSSATTGTTDPGTAAGGDGGVSASAPVASSGGTSPGSIAASAGPNAGGGTTTNTPVGGTPKPGATGQPVTTSKASGKPGVGSTAKPTGTAAAVGPGSSAANTASDVGVTPTQITVCNVLTSGGAFGPYEFTPSYYGAAAYFQALNAAGGINGRTVRYVQHQDDGSTSGNSTQIHTCIDTEKAFAFVANNIYQYAGASYVNQMDIPDIGGQPISTAYYQYPHLYDIEGDLTQRDGNNPGTNGLLFKSDEAAAYLKTKFGVTHMGVIEYDQASSTYGGSNFVNLFKAAGVTVTEYPVNLGLPNFSAAVAQMQADGVDAVSDAIDVNGNQKLCSAIEQNSTFLAQMKVKLSTVSSWGNRYAQSLSSTPNCLAKSYVYTQSANFADASVPEVGKFQAAMAKYFPAQVSTEHQWMLEGYAAAEWFTDAARSCGANLTRTCVEAFMNRPTIYTANGLLDPQTSWFNPQPASYPGSTVTGCPSLAKWDGQKWATVAGYAANCGPAIGYGSKLGPPT